MALAPLGGEAPAGVDATLCHHVQAVRQDVVIELRPKLAFDPNSLAACHASTSFPS